MNSARASPSDAVYMLIITRYFIVPYFQVMLVMIYLMVWLKVKTEWLKSVDYTHHIHVIFCETPGNGMQ